MVAWMIELQPAFRYDDYYYDIKVGAYGTQPDQVTLTLIQMKNQNSLTCEFVCNPDVITTFPGNKLVAVRLSNYPAITSHALQDRVLATFSRVSIHLMAGYPLLVPESKAVDDLPKRFRKSLSRFKGTDDQLIISRPVSVPRVNNRFSNRPCNCCCNRCTTAGLFER